MNENTELSTLAPPARAAVALNSSATEQHLRDLIAKTAAITNVVDKNGREEAHAAAMMLKNARVAVVKVGKEAREDAVAFQKAVVAESDRLAAITADEEARLLQLRNDFDAQVAAEKAEQARIEAERVNAIRNAIDVILAIPAQAAGMTSTQIRALLGQLATRTAMPDEFAEFTEQARTAIETVASALLTMRDNALEREQEAERIEAERRAEVERLAAERAELDRQKSEQERVAAEQRETVRKMNEQAAELERQRAAFAAEQEAAAKRQHYAEQAEASRIAAAEQAIADAQQQATEAREEMVDRIDVNAPIEAIVQVLEIVSEDKPDDEELILLMCATYDMLPFEAIERLAAFNAEAARERHPLPA